MSPASDSDGDEGRTPHSNGKLGRLLAEYDLDELGERMEQRWLADPSERYSLRELAEHVNHHLLQRVMRDAGMNPLDGEVENTYRLLTADDVSTGTRTQARRELKHAGVDVETVETDFVSRQAVHTYLTADRGVSYTRSDDDPVVKESTTIHGFTHRLRATVRSKLERLRTANEVSLGEFEVLLDVRVLCEDCGTQYEVGELLEARSCECSHSPDP